MTPFTTLAFAAQSMTVGITALTAALAFRTGTPSGRRLAAFFGTLGLALFASAVLTGWQSWLPSPTVRWLQIVNVVPVYLIGPFLYAYAASLLQGGTPQRQAREIWHFLPAALAAFVMLLSAIWPPAFAWPGAAVALQVITHAWVVIAVPYLALSAWRLRDAPQRLEEVSADEASLRMRWLRHLITVIAVLWLIIGLERISVALGASSWPWPSALLALAMITVTYLLAWGGLQLGVLMPARLMDRHEAPGDPAASPDPAGRYARSGLGDAERMHIAADLRRLMRERRLHNDGELDLKRLSEQSGWSPNYISQALNQELGQNFFEFVNSMRVADAECWLTDTNDQRSVLDIGLACGFGSKSTFNAVFKRMTGLTPTAFRRRATTSDPAGSRVPVV